MITLLSGAKKNIGDFLIADRSAKVVQAITGEKDFLKLDRWQSIEDRLPEINKTRAVVICGGPAYGRNFYPGILPLTRNLEDIKVPIIPLGLGLEGLHRDKLAAFSFSPESLAAIRHIHEGCTVSGVRDEITFGVLKQNGIDNVVVSGCPVLYDLPSFGKKFAAPETIKKIVLTTPAGRRFFRQMYELAVVVRRRFPEAEIVASFHRGIGFDKYTTLRTAAYNYWLVMRLKMLGISSIDTSYDLSRIEFYRQCDLHIGYRVHAHVNFVSYRRPSFLLHEDTRGIGMSDTLGLAALDVDAYRPDALHRIMSHVDAEVKAGFASFTALPELIESRFETMKSVLAQII